MPTRKIAGLGGDTLASRAVAKSPAPVASSANESHSRLDFLERLKLHELLLERPREPPAADVPAVELLQEPTRALLAELANRRAHEENLARRRPLRASA